MVIKKESKEVLELAEALEQVRARYYDKRARGALALALGLLREAILELRAEAAKE